MIIENTFKGETSVLSERNWPSLRYASIFLACLALTRWSKKIRNLPCGFALRVEGLGFRAQGSEFRG